jgi:hypothetical protein
MTDLRRAAALAASLAAALGAAGAAELPTLRAPPPKPARACTVGGMTGYVVPGSSTCIRISGYVSAEVGIGGGRGPSNGGPPRN